MRYLAQSGLPPALMKIKPTFALMDPQVAESAMVLAAQGPADPTLPERIQGSPARPSGGNTV